MKRAEVRKVAKIEPVSRESATLLWVAYCWNCKSIAYYDTHAMALAVATQHCAVNR